MELAVYPFLLKPIVKEKVWGGRNLERLVPKPLLAEGSIGEAWEAWEGCTIENGAWAGQTLASVIERDPVRVLGAASAASNPRFPLLFKFIDAQDDLSVQVHPDDAQAQAMEHQPFGKTEAWYILHAEPGARLIVGLREDCEPDRIAAAVKENTLVDLLASIPVERGDVVFVPAGTIHAIGRGIVLAEIQENSDTTYRFYDWGRAGKGRDLHISQSMAVSHLRRIAQPKVPSLVIRGEGSTRQILVACRYFAFELLELSSNRARGATNGAFHILSVIDGSAALYWGDGLRTSVAQERGQTVIAPAALGAYELAATGGRCKLLRAFVPDLRRDVVNPLREAGYSDAAIAALGGSIPERNDLTAALQES